MDRFTKRDNWHGTIKAGIGVIPVDEATQETGWLLLWGEIMGMTLVKITMPTNAAGKLIEWEDCVWAYREKEKRKWLRKQEMQRKGTRGKQ